MEGNEQYQRVIDDPFLSTREIVIREERERERNRKRERERPRERDRGKDAEIQACHYFNSLSCGSSKQPFQGQLRG